MDDVTSELTIGRKDFVAEADAWSDAQSAAAQRLPALLEERGIKTVRVAYCDSHGLMRGKSLTTQNFLLALRNGVAETVATLGMDTANIISFPLFERDGGFGLEQMGGVGDLLLVPDPSTLKILPWAPQTAWVLSDLYLKDGSRCPFDCRHIMRSALSALQAEGYDFVAGLELEFYIFDVEDQRLALVDSGQPAEPPVVRALNHGYQLHGSGQIDALEPLADELREAMAGLDLPLRTIEVEWGPGQFEVTFNPLVGLDAADTLLMFRTATKHMMRRQGRLASFMTKPALPNTYSSGWHLHQSLQDTHAASNAFAANDSHTLVSDTGRYYIGGLLAHAAAATAFSNPTINGYKRLNANPLAPNRAVWSHDNRGAMLRLIGGYGAPDTHIENRSGEPCANPYLYMASQIHAGLDGLRHKTDPGDPIQDNPYAQTDKPPLPNSLMQAIDALDQSAALRTGFSDRFVDYYLKLKRSEIARFLSYVTDWEHREYFELY